MTIQELREAIEKILNGNSGFDNEIYLDKLLSLIAKHEAEMLEAVEKMVEEVKPKIDKNPIDQWTTGFIVGWQDGTDFYNQLLSEKLAELKGEKSG